MIKIIFAHPIIKKFWYAFRLLTASSHPTLPRPPATIRAIIWGNSGPSTAQEFPRIIWSYWDGPESPAALACIKTWSINNSDFSVSVLNRASIKLYLEDFPELPQNLPPQKVSNLIRLMLLERYGGIWMDHSTITPRSLDWVEKKIGSSGAELLAFYNEFQDEYRENHAYPIIENGFLAAIPGSKFISRWRVIYQECIQSNDYKNFFSSKKNFSKLTMNFINKDHETLGYFVCYIAAQQAMLESKDFRLLLLNAEDDYYFHYYSTAIPRNKRIFAEELLLRNYENTNLPNLLKITGGHRKRMDEHIAFNCYRVKSILGPYLLEVRSRSQ